VEHAGQLVSVSTNGAFAESYAYDALGRRVSTTDKGGTVYHVYEGHKCAADVDGSGRPLRAYAWGAGIDNLLAMTVFGSAETNTCFAVKDDLGSVHAFVDAQGQVVQSYTYDAWGNVQSAVGNGQSAIATGTCSKDGSTVLPRGSTTSVRAGTSRVGTLAQQGPIELEGG
jgi:YD repeat-containing protein